MASKALPTPEELRQLLDYDPETGALTWRERLVSMFEEGARSAQTRAAAWNNKNSGRQAGYRTPTGYIAVRVNGTLLPAHRVVWALVYGEYPALEIDHIDQDGANNALANLREADRFINNRNRRLMSNNQSGYPGVDWRNGRWRVRINSNRKETVIGHFDTLNEAIAARKSAEAKFGFHPNHGRVRS